MKKLYITLALILSVLVACSPISSITTSEKETDQTMPKLQQEQASGTLRVYYLDVGQGDSTLIQTPKGQHILIDGGDNHKGDEVVDYLKQLGVKSLDAIIATHPDADHIGGLDTVIDAIPVKSVYAPRVSHTTNTYKDFLLAVKNSGLKIKTAKVGLTLPLDGITAEFVAPVAEYGKDLNAWSAVLRVQYGNTSFLFTGDAEARSEKDMLKSPKLLKVDVLKVGHHGSDTSTSQDFLNAVRPTYAVISAGKDNKYGHPKSAIINRLKRAKVTVYRTDTQGTITAVSDGKTIKFDTVR
ncbi:DNA internalization-related competence protein ComEC/Rec2 [Paenibacillus uliginis N3/975]|uniref:DNA internalization-related competence protein ComEC/Rec2 n=1 Tax=Paenibacillus uliginis N3/975 TaxID=1313296 RepID=A0A1X7HK26_9BACL|nr:ComEC/Rec2 family competence protein [Paenibacillus uliginis]SMF88114.1 DNA internalization-related competence protein ComEC/Rec2 [Paenibacillus uliginis N3/975]